ncbi:DUF4384 domain-containing protein [uncultured Massilia sp.]|uniref:DUF4384 domain-containing protein n=1 Tax=uncultured Massilia sp. TaxID=169973 RepID=UPI0025854B92|nr:DUF4384 domain-containing protein [uncultured Massilia sp.]
MKRSLTVLSLLLMSGAAFGQQAYSAKSLFFGEDGEVVAASTGTKPAAKVAAAKPAPKVAKKTLAPKQIGASYFIRLKRADGTTQDVLASRAFRSGDRFQLGVKVNRPSYVYVMNQDPDGNLAQIFPVKGQDNYVDAMGTVFLPARGAFEFDAKPGVEHLLVFLSPKPMTGNVDEQLRSVEPDMVAGLPDGATGGSCSASAALAAAAPGNGDAYAAKGIAFKEDAPGCAAPLPAYAAKGISFSDDPAPAAGGQVATYVVKNTDAKADKNLFLKLKLNHH